MGLFTTCIFALAMHEAASEISVLPGNIEKCPVSHVIYIYIYIYMYDNTTPIC